MDLLEKSEEFYHFLDSVTSPKCIGKIFLEDYEAFVLSPGASTPFSDIVGYSLNPTVIFSKCRRENGEKALVEDETHESTLEELTKATEGRNEEKELVLVKAETPDTTLDELGLSVTTTEYSFSSSCGSGYSLPLPVKSHSIGQPLTSKRIYLTSSSCHYEHQSDILGRTLDVAQDCCFLPLSLSSSRFIHSLYSLGSWKVKSSPPDVWTVCEKNKKNIVALGCVYNASNSTLCAIMVKENEMHSVSAKSVSVEKLSGVAFSEYEIATGGSATGKVLTDMLILQFAWSDANIGMLSPPPENSDAVMKISCTPGYLFSPVLPLFEELKSLHYFCHIASGTAKWLGCDDEDVLASNNKMALSVKGFIEEMAHPLNNPVDVTVISPVCSHMIYEPRIDLDFVEHMWVFCRSLTSYGEIKLVFAEVFKAVILGEIQPFIHKKSSSTLAELLRQVLLHRDNEEIQTLAIKLQLLLSEARLVPCLIQVGLDKVKRDHWSFFVGADILSADHFEHFFDHSDHLSQLEQCIELCKLHNIIELDANLMQTVNLPPLVLSTFTKAVMEIYKKDMSYQPFSRSPIFSLSLSAYSPALKSVVALCSKLSPSTWRVTVQEACGQQCDDSVSSRRICLKRCRPLLSYLQKTDNSFDQYCSYEATCQLVPIHQYSI